MTDWDIYETNIWDNMDDDAYTRNSQLADKRGLLPCTMCGRGVSDGKGWLVFAVNGGGNFLSVQQWPAWESDKTVNHAGDMGYWLLGPECGKKLPKAYRLIGLSNEERK